MNNNNYFHKLIVIATSCLSLMQSTSSDEESSDGFSLSYEDYQVCLENQLSREIIPVGKIDLKMDHIKQIKVKQIDERLAIRLTRDIPSCYDWRALMDFQGVRVHDGTIIIPCIERPEPYHVRIRALSRFRIRALPPLNLEISITPRNLNDEIILYIGRFTEEEITQEHESYFEHLLGEKREWSNYFFTIEEANERLHGFLENRRFKVSIGLNDLPFTLNHQDIPELLNSISYIKKLTEETGRDFDDICNFLDSLYGDYTYHRSFKLTKHETETNRYSIDFMCGLTENVVLAQFFFIDRSGITGWYKHRLNLYNICLYKDNITHMLTECPTDNMYFEYCQVGQKIYRPLSENTLNSRVIQNMMLAILNDLRLRRRMPNMTNVQWIINSYRDLDLQALLNQVQE